MYFVLSCMSPLHAHKALITYEPDDPWRNWQMGRRFTADPPVPVSATIEPGESGEMVEMWDGPLPLMTRRLAQALRRAGVDNLDLYEAEILDVESGTLHRGYVAFNVIGAVAAADLAKSDYRAEGGPLISVDFDSLYVDERKARGALLFRLAESINAILVHESVKSSIEAEGIDTLTFSGPAQWFG